MAKPVSQNNHSGIRRDCCMPFRCCRLLVVLTEGHDLCLFKRQGEVCLNFVRSRNKVVRSLIVGLACTLQGGRLIRDYGFTFLDLKVTSDLLMNSSRVKAPARELVARR
jgi:hypothetical protein